jgi:hypothetical protein
MKPQRNAVRQRCRMPCARGLLAAAMLLGATALSVAEAADAGKVIPLAPADRQELDSLLGAGVVGEALPSQPIQAPDHYLPAKVKLTYRVRDEHGKVTIEFHELSPAPKSEAAAGLQYVAGTDTRHIFERQPDGGLADVRQYDLEKKVVSRFTPGEPLLIQGVQPGESRQLTVKVEVADISSPNDVDYSGSLDITYAYLGTYRVTVPAGSFDADLIKWTYAGKIGPAKIKTAQYRFLAPKAGMVAMIEWRKITALLIYNDSSRRGKLLAAE